MNSMLKKVLVTVSTLAAVGVVTSFENEASAGTATENLNVTASVSANCTIATSPVAFGAYDPVNANASTALDNAGSVSVTCTSGSSTTITLGQGANAGGGSTDAVPVRRMADGGGNFMSYGLFQDAGRTTVWGNTVGTGVGHTGSGSLTAITVYGRVPAAQNLPAGSYSDTVIATVTFLATEPCHEPPPPAPAASACPADSPDAAPAQGGSLPVPGEPGAPGPERPGEQRAADGPEPERRAAAVPADRV
ncbi:MAG: spore coat U domain-containing protein [Polyangiaceae bacterium]|nr:spore coat U domain-containing protein [Polyangiaceae bacterium]